jgi:hypothetical protein
VRIGLEVGRDHRRPAFRLRHRQGGRAERRHHAVLRWESHSEFTTYTWEYGDGQGVPFQPQPDALDTETAAIGGEGLAVGRRRLAVGEEGVVQEAARRLDRRERAGAPAIATSGTDR